MLDVFSGVLFLALLAFVVVHYKLEKKYFELETERNRLLMQIRRQDTELDALGLSEKRAQDLLKEAQKKAQLAIEDAKQRIEESRSIPVIACMNDYQVSNLAVALGTFIKEALLEKKELIN